MSDIIKYEKNINKITLLFTNQWYSKKIQKRDFWYRPFTNINAENLKI
jgi:hypothetical protein